MDCINPRKHEDLAKKAWEMFEHFLRDARRQLGKELELVYFRAHNPANLNGALVEEGNMEIWLNPRELENSEAGKSIIEQLGTRKSELLKLWQEALVKIPNLNYIVWSPYHGDCYIPYVQLEYPSTFLFEEATYYPPDSYPSSC